MDLQLIFVAHHDHDAAADAHRAGREVADADVIRAAIELARADDFRSESLRDVFVKRESRARRLVRVEALFARRIDDVQIDIVRIGFPRERDAQRIRTLDIDALFGGAIEDLGATLRIFLQPRAIDVSELFADHALHAAVPAGERLPRR